MGEASSGCLGAPNRSKVVSTERLVESQRQPYPFNIFAEDLVSMCVYVCVCMCILCVYWIREPFSLPCFRMHWKVPHLDSNTGKAFSLQPQSMDISCSWLLGTSCLCSSKLFLPLVGGKWLWTFLKMPSHLTLYKSSCMYPQKSITGSKEYCEMQIIPFLNKKEGFSYHSCTSACLPLDSV